MRDLHFAEKSTSFTVILSAVQTPPEFSRTLYYAVGFRAAEFLAGFHVGERLRERAAFALYAAEALRAVADGYYAGKTFAFEVVLAVGRFADYFFHKYLLE